MFLPYILLLHGCEIFLKNSDLILSLNNNKFEYFCIPKNLVSRFNPLENFMNDFNTGLQTYISTMSKSQSPINFIEKIFERCNELYIHTIVQTPINNKFDVF